MTPSGPLFVQRNSVKGIYGCCTSKTAMNCKDPTEEYCGSGEGLEPTYIKFSTARYFLSGRVSFSPSPEIGDQLL